MVLTLFVLSKAGVGPYLGSVFLLAAYTKQHCYFPVKWMGWSSNVISYTDASQNH